MMQITKRTTGEDITYRYNEYGEETDQIACIAYDADIKVNGETIGYVQMFENYDEDGDISTAYLATIEIDEQQRCKGYGAEAIKALTAQYGGIYLCPSNERCENLYQRIGEEIEDIPEELEGCYDEYGKMYYIA